MEELKHRWIDDSIIIDFRLPKALKGVIDNIEKAEEDGDDIAYIEWCDVLENASKEYIFNGFLSEKQRDRLLQKYS